MYVGIVPVFILASTVMVHSAFVYHVHQSSYETAYEVCRSTGMRLVRVDTDARRKKLKDFTKEHFTRQSNSFRVSLKYDESSSKFKNPDGEVNKLNKWAVNEPRYPKAKPCVSQFNGQSGGFGRWTTNECHLQRDFVCESGYPADPDIGATLSHPFVLRTLQKTDNGIVCSGNSSEANVYTDALPNALIYRGFNEDNIVQCTIKCTYDQLCTGITFTENLAPDSGRSFCILLKKR